MCSPSAPPAPDPVATAQAQNQVNKDALKTSAQLNQINQNSPYGSISYTGDIGTDSRTQNTTLNPDIQGILDQQVAISRGLSDKSLGRLDQITDQPFSTSGAPEIQAAGGQTYNTSMGLQDQIGDAGNVTKTYNPNTGDIQRGLDFSNLSGIAGNGDFSAERQRVEDSLYDRGASRLDPQFQQSEQAFESQMAAQGIAPGTQAYDAARGNFDRNKTDAYSGLRSDAIAAGGAEQGRLFGQSLSARQQGVGEIAGQGAFTNSAQQQFTDQKAQQAGFENAAQQQQFEQLLASGNFTNQARSAEAGFAQDAKSKQLANDLAIQDSSTRLREGAINEDILGRNQSFNELAAFLNGSPIAPNTPTFQSGGTYNAAQAAPDAVGLAANNYNAAQQARAQILGSIFGAAGTAGGAAAACWVAREVYGAENPRWKMFRRWLFEKAPLWFVGLYLKRGERFALWLKSHPAIKRVIRAWMDKRIATYGV